MVADVSSSAVLKVTVAPSYVDLSTKAGKDQRTLRKGAT